MTYYYYIQDDDFQSLVNGYDFAANTPAFSSPASSPLKHYITKDNWDLWTSSKPNGDYVLSVFPSYSSIEEFTTAKLELLNQEEYTAHSADLTTDDESYVDNEWVFCERVLKSMGAELRKLKRQSTINDLQALQLQDLFSKQESMVFPSLGGISLSVPITEYLGQNHSLKAARLRLENTNINLSIGFTQELKDKFLNLMDKEITALDA